MKNVTIDRLETHDRLIDFKKKNQDSIEERINKMIVENPFDGLPFYIFAHKRTLTDAERLLHFQTHQYTIQNIPSHKIVWQPRLQKPKAQTNSMLFKVDPSFPDQVKVIWILPDRDQWDASRKGTMFQDPTVVESIEAFDNDRQSLERPEPDDPTDEKARAIYKKLYPNLWERLFGNNE
jgi:hypothetical protein